MLHSIWWNGLHIYLNSVICDILFDGAATSGIGLQRPALTNADWLSCYIFTRESSYCFHRVLVWKLLLIGTDMLLTITSTGDRLFGFINIDDLERPLTPKRGVFSEFFSFLRARASIAIACISYGNSVCTSVYQSVHLSVCFGVTTRYRFKTRWDRDFMFTPHDSPESLVFCDKISCRWVKGAPERGEEREACASLTSTPG